MLFRRCTINGCDYNHPPSDLEDNSSPNTPPPPIIVNTNLIEDMCQTDHLLQLNTESQRIQEFLLVLAICNTVVVSASPHRDIMNASGQIECVDDSSVQIVRSSDTSTNINGSSQSAG